MMGTNNHFKVVFIPAMNEVEPVPHQWEQDGILFWPPTKREVRILQSKVDSSPNPDTWTKYKCQLKAEGILLYSHASSTADKYCQDSTTDEENSQQFESKKRDQRDSRPPARFYDLDFNSEVSTVKSTFEKGTTEKDMSSFSSVESNLETNSNISSSICFSVTPTEEFDKTIVNNTLDKEIVIDKTVINTGSEDRMSIVSNIQFNNFMEMFSSYKENMEAKWSELAVKIDRIDEMLKSQIFCDINETDKEDLTLFPINSVEKINEFEKKLQDDHYRKKIKSHLRRVIGSGQLWKNAAYKLSATLFTKEILTLYSWTGVSRTSEKKEAFNKLLNILDVFYSVVSYSDNSFTHKQKEEFFRDGVLKHSRSRMNPKKKISRGNEQLAEENKQVNENIEEEKSADVISLTSTEEN